MAKTPLESRTLDGYANNPRNYLNDWARRTGHTEDADRYEVEVTIDPDTGFAYGNVVERDASRADNDETGTELDLDSDDPDADDDSNKARPTLHRKRR